MRKQSANSDSSGFYLSLYDNKIDWIKNGRIISAKSFACRSRMLHVVRESRLIAIRLFLSCGNWKKQKRCSSRGKPTPRTLRTLIYGNISRTFDSKDDLFLSNLLLLLKYRAKHINESGWKIFIFNLENYSCNPYWSLRYGTVWGWTTICKKVHFLVSVQKWTFFRQFCSSPGGTVSCTPIWVTGLIF